MDKSGDFAFVIMPFASEFDDIYKLGIKQAALDCGVNAERLDEQLFDEGMLDRIYRQIDAADFVIADVSGRNSNVFYELGYAHAKEKICLLLTKDVTDIPFDLQHKRHVVYGDSIAFLKDELKRNINWAKKESKARRENKISIVAKQPTGDLSVTEYSATANLVFTFDLHNRTERVSPEISAVYLYSGNNWQIRVDGRECPFSDSDVQPFKYRYLIPAPASKIGKNGWSQLRFKASRTLAYAWKGDAIKNSYTLAGRGLLRLETVEGNIDHEFDFNIIVEDMPF